MAGPVQCSRPLASAAKLIKQKAMTRRRQFLKTLGNTLLFALPARAYLERLPQGILEQARETIRTGRLGEVEFCRVGHDELVPIAQFVLGDSRVEGIVEVDAAAEGVALLGRRATLVVDRAGCRLFKCRSGA
jgi:hypothetical protein